MVRVSLFVFFFSIGTTTLAVAILGNDLFRYYQNKNELKSSQATFKKLQTLNKDYDSLLKQLQEDPTIVKRIAPVTLGTEPEGKDTIYPKAKAEQLAAAKKALTEDKEPEPAKPGIPEWVRRCNEPAKRAVLFLAGTALILISFVCFGPNRRTKKLI